MSFTLGRSTSDLQGKLGMRFRIGAQIAYDAAQQIAVVADRVDHSLYPDLTYTLWCGKSPLKIWVRNSSASVTLPQDFEDRSEEFLKSALTTAFLLLLPERKVEVHVGRKKQQLQPAMPRDPTQLMATLNKIVEEFPPLALDMGRQMFVPLCVMPEELVQFRAYGEQSSWKELSENARKFVSESLALYDAKTGTNENTA